MCEIEDAKEKELKVQGIEDRKMNLTRYMNREKFFLLTSS